MSLVARIALGVAILAVLAVGAVIFYVLPQLEAPADNAASTVAASAPPSNAAPSDTAPAPVNPQPAQTTTSDTPAPASPGSDASAPAAPAPVEAAPAPAPLRPSPVPSAGAPIPLAPAPNPASAAAALAPLDPARPGAGNIAEFVNQTMAMGGTADARSLPLAEAPVLTRLQKGSAVKVTGVLAGNLWLQVELPDQRAAYIPAAAIPDLASQGGAPAPAPAPAQPSFMAVSKQLTTTAPTPVYGAPDLAGPPKQTLQAGTQVQIVAKSDDGQWAWLQMPDGQEAYVKMATLAAAPPAPVLPDTLKGRAKVVNTATLIVDGRRIQLFGIRGEGGAYVAQLRSLIESRGGVLSCYRRDTLYTCSLPGDLDIARAALFNGAALPTANAPPDYQDQAAAARAARRGVWGR